MQPEGRCIADIILAERIKWLCVEGVGVTWIVIQQGLRVAVIL